MGEKLSHAGYLGLPRLRDEHGRAVPSWLLPRGGPERGGRGGQKIVLSRMSPYKVFTKVVNNMLDEVDVDGSGTLSFSEFLIFMRQPVCGSGYSIFNQ